ncbi:MAG TPA: hypothetical protein VLC92_15380 [Rhodocyclaceae bacterium]|nr:hypothetical protein [Rhodocyclaceae bacterium]
MLDNQTLGIVCVTAGIALPLLAWTFFRKDEYKFFTFAPFNEAHKYMRAPGGVIWWTGIAILCVGIFNCWAAP